MERFSDLKNKEVINICDGTRYGYIRDLEIDIQCAKIIAVIIPIEGKMWGFFCPEEEYRIPWCCIVKIGEDIILVDVNTDEILQNTPK